MYTSFKNSIYGALVKTTFFVLPVLAISSTQCNGVDFSFTPSDRAALAWTMGPADASLGSLADIKISKGYRFTDASGAKEILRAMKNPVPDGLVGILAPESGQWYAVLTYTKLGYVKDADNGRIDSAAILKTITDRAQRQNEERALHGLPPITSVEWKLPPVFDPKAHTVEWAVQAGTASGQVINHAMRLLGRQGVLDATVVEPYEKGSDLTSLKGVMANISFKPGQRYTDYQKGDTVADTGLAGLIIGQDELAAAQNAKAPASGRASGWGWYWYVGVGALAGGSALLLRGALRRRGHTRHHLPAAIAASNGISNGNGTASRKSFSEEHTSLRLSAPLPSDNGHEPNGVKPAVLAAIDSKPKQEVINDETVVRNGSHHRPGARRRKVFDYHRFYTDTVLKLSSGSYTGPTGGSNGGARANGRTNGYSLDKTAQAQSPAHAPVEQTIVQAHLDLIANQKELIEQQKRLMIQQAKLIEEKSKLIAEKSQLLDRQTELFERDIL